MKEVLDAITEVKSAVETNIKEVGTKVEVLENKMTDADNRLKEVESKFKAAKYEIPGLEEEKKEFSFVKAIAAIRFGDWSKAGFEKEVFDATAKVMSAGSDSAGGYIVPTVYIPELIELLRANAVVMKAGATVLSDLKGSPIEIPSQTGGATAYWVAENSAITASDLTLGQVQMSPKACAALVKLSNRLLKNSNPSAEAMIRRDIAQVIALAIDLKALRGDGSGATPTGIANTSNINTYAIGGSGGFFSFADASAMQGTLEDDNALKGNLGFVTHGAVKRSLKNQRIAQFSGDTGGQYIVPPIMSDAQLADLLGGGMYTTSQLPVNLTKGSATDCSEVYFGNWQELLVGQWGGLEIMASTETSDAFEKNQTWVRVIQEVDVAVRHAASFCLCSDARTTGY